MPTRRSIASAAERLSRRRSIWRASRARLRARRLRTSPDVVAVAPLVEGLDGRAGIAILSCDALMSSERRAGCGACSSADAAATNRITLPKRAEERTDVADEEIGRFHRGEVAATLELRPVDDVVAALSVAADGDVLSENGDAGWRGGGLLAPAGGVHVLVIHLCRRACRPGEPVEHHIREDTVTVNGGLRQIHRWVGPFLELFDNPGELAYW